MHAETQVRQQPNTTTLPLSSQVACALLIIRSKPNQIPIEEHLQHLRSAIVRQEADDSSKSPNLGSLFYWQSAHQASERERLALVDEVAKLEKELEMLQGGSRRASLDVGEPSAFFAGQEQPYRGVNDDTGEAANDKDNTSHPTNFADRQQLLRGIFSLKHNLRLQTPDYAKLSASIRLVTTTIYYGIVPTKPEHTAQRISPDARLGDQLGNVLEDAYPLILQGLSLLQRETCEESQSIISAVPDVVRLFTAILSGLHKSVQDAVAHRKETTDTPGPSSQDRLGRYQNFSVSMDCSKQFRSMSTILTRMVLHLDLSQNAHCEAFEGFLCALLDHMGSLLSLLVFSTPDHEPRSDVGILPPKGLLGTPHSNLEVAIESVKIEGPYVISVLREATDFLQSNMKVMSERSLLLFTTRKMPDDKGLRHAVEERLQKTLLRGVFGDDDATFSGGLCRHHHLIEPDMDSLMNEMKPDANTSEWFIGQLWEHLGWDILSGRDTCY
ncbi:hypothetical protein, variant [Exophiala oligosperma]|uniref:Uncharacterized protein n=1 Tax=Exophiala oligosperma TaxID=215243 RepID=A0A0D2D778_9EURO|nr:hypothetical protein, variant [Exophiala oligosperma]KIW38993.1 hypothetical protein, variant [Exophiala oligosperma]